MPVPGLRAVRKRLRGRVPGGAAMAVLLLPPVDDGIVVVMGDQRGAGRDGLPAEERRRAVLAAFIGAGVLEMPGRSEEVARAYREQHPDRADSLDDLLATLGYRG
jgi:hypothetical protein